MNPQVDHKKKSGIEAVIIIADTTEHQTICRFSSIDCDLVSAQKKRNSEMPALPIGITTDPVAIVVLAIITSHQSNGVATESKSRGWNLERSAPEVFHRYMRNNDQIKLSPYALNIMMRSIIPNFASNF